MPFPRLLRFMPRARQLRARYGPMHQTKSCSGGAVKNFGAEDKPLGHGRPAHAVSR